MFFNELEAIGILILRQLWINCGAKLYLALYLEAIYHSNITIFQG